MRIYIYIGDAEAFHAELFGRGAKGVLGLESTSYGVLEFHVEDLDGNRIRFGQQGGGAWEPQPGDSSGRCAARRLEIAMPSPPTAERRRFEVGTPEQFRWLGWIVRSVLLLNLFDAIFTLYWVRAGWAREANSLIEQLVEENALGFVAVKLTLVSAGSWLLWEHRRRPASVVAIFVIFVVYYLVLLHHLQFASRLARALLGLGS